MNILSICIYSIFFALTLICAYEYRVYSHMSVKINGIDVKHLFLIGLILLPCIIAALRYNVGTDYSSYVNMYNNIKGFNSIDFFGRYIFTYIVEPLFYYLCRFTYFIFDDPSVLFFLSELIISIFIYLGIKKFKIQKDIVIAYFIFLFFFFPISLNIIRQSIAMAILFFAFSCFYNKQYKLTAIFITIAGLFHFSSFIFYVIFIFKDFKNKKINKYRDLIYPVLVILTPISTVVFLKLLQGINLVSFYISRYEIDISNSGIGFLIPIIPVVIPLLIIIYKKNLNNDRNFLHILQIYLLNIPLAYLGYFAGYALRLSYYPKLLEIFIIPFVLSKISNQKTKIYCTIYFCAYYLGYFIIYYMILNQNGIFPFNFIF